MTLDSIIDQVLDREGGYVDRPEDHGGPTNWGVTVGTLESWRGKPQTADDVKTLGRDEARAIYRNRYIIEPGFAELPDPLRGLVIDTAVNFGPPRATQFLQTALRVTADGVIGGKTHEALKSADHRELYRRVLAERVRYRGQRIRNHRDQSVFAAGWANRDAEFIEGCP